MLSITVKRILIVGILFSATVSGVAQMGEILNRIPSKGMQPIATIASMSGSPTLNGSTAQLRKSFDPRGVTVDHGFSGDIGILLGNHVSFFSSDRSNWSVTELEGFVRVEDIEPWVRETTRSNTRITLSEGSLVIHATHLNDESSLVIATPLGDFDLTRGSAKVNVRHGLVNLHVFSGQGIFSNDDSDNPLMLSDGEFSELSGTSSIHLGRAERKLWEPTEADLRHLEIAQGNARRIHFPKNAHNPSILGVELTDVLWVKEVDPLKR